MKEKIMGFAQEHWCEMIIAGAVVVAECAICKIYKDWLYKQ